MCVIIKVRAQSNNSYTTFGAGFDVGSTRGFTDLVHQNPGYSFDLHFNYNYSPYVPISLELQHGLLSGGGDTKALDQNLRKYQNNYTALMLHIDPQLGSLLDFDNDLLDIVKNWYVGFGAGGIYNYLLTNRVKPDGSHYVFPGKDRSKEFLAMGKIGYALKLYNGFGEATYVITVCYTHNFDIGDGLDGYNDPTAKFKNQDVDQYRQISIGFTYNFGAVQPYYRKRNYGRHH
ncbi:hypothetical protein KXD93_28890 [Mucilaginibacter sp. BJC16-A38]|uniref:hypothetical protein n=1 Tax=Mucilaginibacter phenanthrenivorans TaxID=1234842 RepID=UPI002157F26C|nr:hypothetical protein [Mucilaginibacter phenanthrenivorans]MCR8561707.1 hypothetical protein [Mucilaginibacter phenanthrenivorans]